MLRTVRARQWLRRYNEKSVCLCDPHRENRRILIGQSSSEPFPQPSSYQVDAENIAEMARLIRQARLLGTHLGLFPNKLDLTHSSSLLDIGCGPGEWVLEIAQRFPAS
jgi:tRNA G46 methylase TrmB